MKEKVLMIGGSLVVGVAAGVMYANAAYAHHEDKLKVCHATHSQKNPYVMIEVSRDALNGHDNQGDFIPKEDADDCTMPVPTPTPTPTSPTTSSPTPAPTAI